MTRDKACAQSTSSLTLEEDHIVIRTSRDVKSFNSDKRRLKDRELRPKDTQRVVSFIRVDNIGLNAALEQARLYVHGGLPVQHFSGTSVAKLKTIGVQIDDPEDQFCSHVDLILKFPHIADVGVTLPAEHDLFYQEYYALFVKQE